MQIQTQHFWVVLRFCLSTKPRGDADATLSRQTVGFHTAVFYLELTLVPGEQSQMMISFILVPGKIPWGKVQQILLGLVNFLCIFEI